MKRANEILNHLKNGMNLDKNSSQENTPTGSDANEPCSICGAEGAQNICRGLGMFRYDVEMGDPRFGKMFRCPNNPVEHDSEHQARLRRVSNLSAFGDKTFENFEARDGSLELALRQSRAFAMKREGWLLLEGTYGCGKTHLAAAIGNERLKRGEIVLFITSPDLLDHLRSAYAPDSELTYDQTFERVRNAELLILDDLGVENPSPWAQEKLFQLLNHRYMHRMTTVITTNQNIDKLDPRIRSRLLDVEHTHRVKITATDYRNPITNENEIFQHTSVLYSEYTFQNFETEFDGTQDEINNLRTVKHDALYYAQNLPNPWFVLLGKHGCGKTHLVAAIANYWISRGLIDGQDVMFISVPELVDYLMVSLNKESDQSFNHRFHLVKNVPYLILEDFGTDQRSEWVRERIFQIIDYRYVTRKPTVFTLPKPIGSLNERAQSRLLDQRISTLVEFNVRRFIDRSPKR